LLALRKSNEGSWVSYQKLFLTKTTLANGINMRLMRLAAHSNIHNDPTFQHSAVLEAST
jgi:hypothetical protein